MVKAFKRLKDKVLGANSFIYDTLNQFILFCNKSTIVLIADFVFSINGSASSGA